MCMLKGYWQVSACKLCRTVIVLRYIPASTSFFSFLLSSDLRPHQIAVTNKNGKITGERCPGHGLKEIYF